MFLEETVKNSLKAMAELLHKNQRKADKSVKLFRVRQPQKESKGGLYENHIHLI